MAESKDMALKDCMIQPTEKSYFKNKKFYENARNDKEKDYKERNFGFSRVLWEVKNYCVVQFNRNKVFYSPEFYVRGSHLTKWRMIVTRLYAARNTYAVNFCLVRLPCEPYINDAIADCVLEYNDHYAETTEIEFIKTFGVHTENSRNHRLTSAGIIPINKNHSDIFQIKLYILVYFPDSRDTFRRCINVGIRGLGEDLFNLCESGIMADLKLCFQTRDLDVHKAILLHRLTDENFQRLTLDSEFILLEDFEAEPAEKVIRFLYTGDMNYTTNCTEPAVAVFRFAELLGVKPVVAYYNPDEITLNSDIEVEEYYTKWIIQDFCNRDDHYLESPIMINGRMDTKWRLRVYPNGFNKNGEHVYISIEYKTDRVKDICANIFLGRPDDESTSHIDHKMFVPGGTLRGLDFVRRDEVINNYMSDDSVTICLRIRLSTGEENSSVGPCTSSYKRLPEKKIYERFSNDILSIYENERFADKRLDFEDHNISILTHEYILHVRCTFLSYTLNRFGTRYFRNTSHAVIFELFHFLYSGLIREHICLEDMFDLYKIAEYFNFESMDFVLLNRVYDSLSATNAGDVLNFAYEIGNAHLQNSARDFLGGD